MQMWEVLFMAIVTGGASSIATIAALRTDITWIKQSLKEHNKRINKLEIER